MASGATLRRRLVREMEEKGVLHDPAVRDAFLTVPRELFVPEYAAEQGLDAVYRDQAIVTKQTESGYGLSSSSQPGIMIAMLQELGLEPGHRVLEIGAGTGYNAALLAHIVGDEGRVVSVELDPEVARRARRALKAAGAPVRVVTGDGRQGHPPGSPYDRIIVTASAGAVPRAWLEQLAPEGLLEAPLQIQGSGAIQLIPTLRRENGRLRSVSVICGGFMPIRSSPEDLSPYWPMLSISRADGAESTRLLALGGNPARRFSPGAARRLIATACSKPRSRRLGMRAPAEALNVFLILRGPGGRLISSYDGREYLMGLAGRDGRSIALLGGWPTASTIRVHGDDSAANELDAIVREWDRRGRPGVSSLALTVDFRNGSSVLRTRWRGR